MVYDYVNGTHSATQRKSTVNGTSESWQKYSYERNDWGQKTAVTVSRGSAKDSYTGTLTLAEYVYAANNGHLEKEYYGDADASGTDYAEFTYDILDRVIRVEYNSGRYICNTYNAEGNLAKVTYGDDTTELGRYIFEYDSLGRPIRSYEYDGSGNLIQSVEQLYDEYSRLTTQNWVVGNTPYSESYTYNDPPEEGEIVAVGTPQDGSLATVTTATGDVLTFTYDALKRLQQVQATDEYGTPIINTRYAYRSTGSAGNTLYTTNRIQYHNVRIGDVNDSVLAGGKYTYDGVGNITAIAQSTSPFNLIVTYEYDDYNQLIKETYYDGNGNGEDNITVYYEYTYDTAGNILTISENGTQTKAYSYTNSAWQDMLTSVNGLAIAYEGQTYTNATGVSGTAVSGNPVFYQNGSLCSNGTTPVKYHMEWTNGRQLTHVYRLDDAQTRIYYDYDGDGIRTNKYVEGVLHTYVTQNGKIVRETIGTGSTAKILDFLYDNNGQPYALKYYSTPTATPRTFHYILNLQGDVVKLVEILSSSNGIFEERIVANYTYNAWGEILSATGEMAETNPLRYRGYYYDTETGFYYLQSRYYDPANCRFINADGYTSTGQGFLGYNMFAYCNNSPVVLRDSIGIAPIETIDINGDGTIDCYVYEYSYSGYAPLGMGTSATIPVSGSGKIYIFDGVSEDYITNPQNHPEGFNSDTDFMGRYYIDRTEDGRRNYVIQIADSCKCRIEVQMRAVAKELRSFGAQYKRSWKRTEDSIVTEWKEHNRYAFLSDSAKHTDFDTEEEGKGFFYFAWKAFKRAVF